MIGSKFLAGRDRYERVMEGWVDATHESAFTLTAQLSDNDAGVEVVAVATPSPGYEIIEARARALSGDPERVSPGILADFPALAGTRMVSGFTRRLAEITAERPGAHLVMDAAIEVARLARQATKLSPDKLSAAKSGDPKLVRQLDLEGWVDLPGSCFAYSPEATPLFETLPVTIPMTADLYFPPPGKRKLFNRKKVARLERNGRRLFLFHSMFDEVHGFELSYEVDLDAGTILGADSKTSRLPYMGVCDEPQKKIASLVGQQADQGLRKRIQTLLGGSSGCSQLYDLTSDLLKLLAFA